MNILLLCLAVFCVLGLTYSTVVNDKGEIFCVGANVTEVRITNCDAEPCTVKKGELLPVQIDFIFRTPSEAKEIYFDIFIGYWGVTSTYGSYLAKEKDCKELMLSSCPPKPGVKYTLQSNVYVDPESKDSLNGEKSGKRFTSWNVFPKRGDNSLGSDSSCIFSVLLNIIE